MLIHVERAFREAQLTLERFLANPANLAAVDEISRIVAEALKRGNRIYTCGNGGSTCDAMHFAEELTGRYRDERPPLAAQALCDPSHITCTANDYGFDHIFSRAVSAYGRSGDVLIVLSTSGNSTNVINAVRRARELSITTIGLLGKSGGLLKDLVDLAIVAPAQVSDRIQEIHIKILHIVIEAIERRLFPDLYPD